METYFGSILHFIRYQFYWFRSHIIRVYSWYILLTELRVLSSSSLSADFTSQLDLETKTLIKQSNAYFIKLVLIIAGKTSKLND